MEFHGVSMELHGVPWSSMECHGVSMELHGVPWSLHRVPWSLHGVPWNSMESPRSFMDFHGIPWSPQGDQWSSMSFPWNPMATSWKSETYGSPWLLNEYPLIILLVRLGEEVPIMQFNYKIVSTDQLRKNCAVSSLNTWC